MARQRQGRLIQPEDDDLTCSTIFAGAWFLDYGFLFFNSRSLRSSGRAVAATQASAALGSTSSHWRGMVSMLELRWVGALVFSAPGAAPSGYWHHVAPL